MKLGLSLCPEVGRWRDTVAQARLAEDLGFDSIWLPEHHLMAGYAPSPMLGMAGLVEVTDRIALGTNIVVAPFQHPVRLAEEALLVQEMSEGRFVYGLGLGYRREEFAAFGVPFEERGARLEESLVVVRRLMRERDVHHEGRFFSLDGVTIYPRLDDPPPIWLGGWADTAIRRAARHADVWFPGPTADFAKLRRCLHVYDAALAEQGETRTELPLFREVWVADDRQLLEAGEAPLRQLYADDYMTWREQEFSGVADVGAERFIVGDPERVAEQLRWLATELGVTHLVARLHFHGIDEQAVERSMRLLSEAVRPQIEEAVGGG